jgi:hypothetical protein
MFRRSVFTTSVFRRSVFRHLASALVLTLATLTLPALAQSDTQDKSFDLHVGKDADAQKVGLPLYPGARPKHEDDNDPLNFGISAESFGLQLVVAKYESEDPPAKVLDFYRDKLKKYGKVLECHSQTHGGDVKMNDNKDSKDTELKCEQDSGPVTELKVGTQHHQHVVAVEPRDANKGATFSLVYLYARGKQGDI